MFRNKYNIGSLLTVQYPSFFFSSYLVQFSGYGTNLEGPFPIVSRAIEACHEAVHAMGVC